MGILASIFRGIGFLCLCSLILGMWIGWAMRGPENCPAHYSRTAFQAQAPTAPLQPLPRFR